MAQIKTVINTSANRCQRCNRQLKNPFARYGWRCAEILGVAQNLNYAGDGAFSAYTLGLNEANDFLRKSNIDIKKINLVKFYESYAKLYLAVGMNNSHLYGLAYDDLLISLSPGYDKNGKMLVADTLSPPLSSYLAWFDDMDAANGKFSTTAFTNNTFNPYAFQLQILLNQNGTTDKFGNKLKEDGIFGPKTQWAADVAKVAGDVGKGIDNFNNFSRYQFYPPKGDTVFGVRDMHAGRIKNGKPVGVPMIRIDAPDIKTPYNHLNIHEATTGIKDPTPHIKIGNKIFNSALTAGKVGKVIKTGGRALAVVGVALDTLEFYDSFKKDDYEWGNNTSITTGGITGSWGGGVIGAKAGAVGGAAIGASIGALFGGVGAAPGAAVGGLIGGLIGGVGGSFGGRIFGEYIGDYAYDGKRG